MENFQRMRLWTGRDGTGRDGMERVEWGRRKVGGRNGLGKFAAASAVLVGCLGRDDSLLGSKGGLNMIAVMC